MTWNLIGIVLPKSPLYDNARALIKHSCFLREQDQTQRLYFPQHNMYDKSRTNKKNSILTIPSVNTCMKMFSTSESVIATMRPNSSTGMVEHCAGPTVGLITMR